MATKRMKFQGVVRQSSSFRGLSFQKDDKCPVLWESTQSPPLLIRSASSIHPLDPTQERQRQTCALKHDGIGSTRLVPTIILLASEDS
ncbi:hypothetical protein I79_024697 [Cricetulus griseus]|uniref:Uncharacterized protein n=1 Tax=Cricetulus griseus TaxID=10029 RepID=G3ILD3_CRIGR|nr:hypothetical protein I79_024697 [Cricetulus griseus]